MVGTDIKMEIFIERLLLVRCRVMSLDMVSFLCNGDVVLIFLLMMGWSMGAVMVLKLFRVNHRCFMVDDVRLDVCDFVVDDMRPDVMMRLTLDMRLGVSFMVLRNRREN